jgi:hypothetical protein
MPPIPPIESFLFTTDVPQALAAQHAGISSVIVDWENQGKYERQRSYDTEINRHSVDALSALTAALKIPVTVRINGLPFGAPEIETALDHGARIIMLPMARTPAEVDTFLKSVRGRAKTLVQIETAELAEQCAGLIDLGWDYAFIGLNDLMISRGGHWLWEPLYDGTVEKIFRALPGRQVGFGGITAIGGGHPLPFIELLREFSRLGATFSFMRRTFHREMVGRDLAAELAAVQAVWTACNRRSPETVAADHRAFQALLTLLRASAVGGAHETTPQPFSGP